MYNFNIGVCVISKNEELNLVEWIEHHKNIGFNNILFYDNNENNNQYNLLLPYIKSGFIIYHDFRNLHGLKLQHTAYQHTKDKYFKTYDWIAFFDADEFLMLTTHKTIHDFLNSNKKFIKADGVCFNWKNTTDNNIITMDKRLITQVYKIAKPRSTHKTIVNTKLVKYNKINSVHSPFCNPNNLVNSACRHDASMISSRHKCYCKNAYILHTKYINIYNTINRINRGDCNGGRRYDASIFEERLKHEILRFFDINKITQEKINVLYDAFPDYKDYIYNLLKDKYPNIQK